MKNEQELRLELGKILAELELINNLRRKDSKRYDVLMSRAQTLAWVVGDRFTLDYTPTYAQYKAVRGATTLEEHRANLRDTHPELFPAS